MCADSQICKLATANPVQRNKLEQMSAPVPRMHTSPLGKEVPVMLKRIGIVSAVVFGLAVVWMWAAPVAYADEWDKATKITVNQPFEIPGMVLPAGTYVMKIMDLQAERHVVRFLNEDQTVVYATIIAIPNFRLEPTENTEITFYEAEVNRPRAMHAWFYPGYQYGVEFLYPTAPTAIATAVGEPVIAFKEPEPVIEEPEPVVAANEPEEKKAELAEVYPYFEPTAEPELDVDAFAQPLPEQLPRTATPFPVVGLVGLLAAGAASFLRFRR